MRAVSALDVRRSFGQLLDDASGGERIVIERAGQPIAALVPLSDLAALDPERRRGDRLRAIEEVRRAAKGSRGLAPADIVEAIRGQRRLRDQQVMRSVRPGTRPRAGKQ
jgi:prevent-host-death family protein